MIPKKIHYIWFSDEPYPPLIQKCIASWKKYCPDYEIILWNTKNFDVHMNQWCSEAFEAKKYAFVTDYARLYVLYHEGGIFLDSDVEIIKNMDEFLQNAAFFSFTAKPEKIQAETIGSEKGCAAVLKLLAYYEGRSFIKSDGTYDTKTIDEILYDSFTADGLINNKEKQTVNGVTIYPPGYFLMTDDIFYLSGNSELKYLNNMCTLHYALGGWHNVDNRLYRFLKKGYLKHFKQIYKIVKNPVLFNLLVPVVNQYRQSFWANQKP